VKKSLHHNQKTNMKKHPADIFGIVLMVLTIIGIAIG
jgi:hypothetical protein